MNFTAVLARICVDNVGDIISADYLRKAAEEHQGALPLSNDFIGEPCGEVTGLQWDDDSQELWCTGKIDPIKLDPEFRVALQEGKLRTVICGTVTAYKHIDADGHTVIDAGEITEVALTLRPRDEGQPPVQVIEAHEADGAEERV